MCLLGDRAAGDVFDLPLDALAYAIDRLAAAEFPVMVISGDHSRAFEAVCDSLAEALSAERAVIPGRPRCEEPD